MEDGKWKMEDGKWKMEDVWYNLDGPRVDGKPLAKGLYVHDGRTVIMK